MRPVPPSASRISAVAVIAGLTSVTVGRRAAHGRGVHDRLGRSGIKAQHGQRRAAIGLGDADEPAGGLGELHLEVGAMAGPGAGVRRPGDARRVGAGAGVVARDLQWRPIAATGSDEQDRDERDESAHRNDGRNPGRARSIVVSAWQ